MHMHALIEFKTNYLCISLQTYLMYIIYIQYYNNRYSVDHTANIRDINPCV